MSEQAESTPPEASSDSATEKIHPSRQLWRDVVAGTGVNRDGTPRRQYSDEELIDLKSQIETASKTADKASWPDWVRRYESGGVPINDLFADLDAETQRRLSVQAATAKAEALQATVAIEDGGRISEQQQLEELRRQLLVADLQIARLTESNQRLLDDNHSLRQELEKLKPRPDLQTAQPKPARKGFLQRIFGESKPAAPVAEEKPAPPQAVATEPTRPAREVRWTEGMSRAELLELREKFVNGEAVTETGRRLKIGPFLSTGLIGAVYPAIDEGGRRCAVKLPAPNLGKDALIRFNEETTVMESFYKAWRQRYPNDPVPFPEVIKLTSTQYLGKEIKGAFGLEWFPEESLLSGNLPGREEHGWEREVGLTAAALDYSRMLEVLNQDLHISCRDRKTTDLRLREDRLVVLDWNVTESVEPRYPNYGKLHPDDVYVFGALWYQMAVWRYPPAVVNPLGEDQWNEAVSYQMRFFLAKCLSPAAAERTSGSLVAETEEMLKRMNEAPEVLLEKGLEKLKSVKSAARTAGNYLESMRRLVDTSAKLEIPNVGDAQEALIYLDLARRKGLSDAEQPYRDAVSLLKKNIPNLAIGEAAHHFSIIQYGLMEKGLKLLEPLSRGNPQLRLRWGRWEQLKQIGATALQEGVGLREHIEEITNIMRMLEADEWLDDTKLTDAQQRLAKVTAAIPDGQVKTLFGNLEIEIILRQSLAGAGQAEADGDFSQAASQARRVLEIAKNIQSRGDNPYFSSLSEFIPSERLEREMIELEAMAKTQEGIIRWQEIFKETQANILTGVPEEFQQLDIVLLSRQLETLSHRLPATAQGDLNRMREQLGTLRDLSFALGSGDFDRARILIDGLR